MSETRPFTPETLAERWGCSAETIRQLAARGELSHFRVGRMIRIPAAAVQEIEACQISASSGSEEALQPSGTTGEVAAATSSRPRAAPRPRLKLVTSSRARNPRRLG
ncbi:excisionase family DNA-binding protein [Cereibacter azotoformans]|uniref:excisionase family DNA-binding protein n=1 Tax=Cereibacter azotoformans TaxID=43057 RepID=UPI003B8A6317